MLGLHFERGPENETAGEMYRRVKQEHKEGKDRSHPLRSFFMGAVRSVAAGTMYNETTSMYAEERASIRNDVAARGKNLTEEEIEEKTDATMNSRLGIVRTMMTTPCGRPLPDISGIREPGGMEHGGYGR